jgi:hypothetical protein
MRLNCPVVGVDVAKDFCLYAAISPQGETFLKTFKASPTFFATTVSKFS